MKTLLTILLMALLCAVVAVTVSAWRSYLYPFGRRPCTLQCMFGGLEQYASEHEGWFPKSDRGSYAALQQLYPTNCSALEVAGVTGNIGLVEAALKQGKLLNEALTSWVYMPGFRNDDPHDIAILWESRGGFFADGRRNSVGARPVLFIGGHMTNIPAADWEAFLRGQEQMRKTVLAQRYPRTNSPAQRPP